MDITQSRRRFLAGLSAAGAAGLLGARPPLAAEPPPEVTTVRIGKLRAICLAPGYVGDELLRMEGFDEIRYVPEAGGAAMQEQVGRGEVDFGIAFAAGTLTFQDAGVPITVLGGIHAGCYELFAHEPVRTVSDLKGRRVGVHTLRTHKHLYVAIMANHVGLDPHTDIDWVTDVEGDALELFANGELDAYLGFPPEPQMLRAQGMGRVILDTNTVRPWSQYLCCMIYSNRDFVRANPVATKRYLRAVLKATDFCAANPELAARRLVDGDFVDNYDLALQTLNEVDYGRWRDYDAADTLRFWALRLHEVGMIDTSPLQLLAEGGDWRFIEELKQELRA